MAVRVVWTSYGRPAAAALRDAVVSSKGGGPLAPVTVVVPSNHVGVAARRLLASGALGSSVEGGAGLVAVSFVTLFRLAELLGAPLLAGQGRRPVSTPVIAAAVRAALSEAPGMFGPVAAHPATESALVSTYRELREVSESGLEELARSGPRPSEVVRLHRSARARLAPAWYDEQDLMAAAATVLTKRGTAATAALGPFVVYVPQGMSPHQRQLVSAAGDAVAVTLIAALTGDGRADAEVVDTARALGITDGPAPLASVPPVERDRTSIVLASDADDEVRAGVRAVLDAVRSGIALDRVALLFAAPDPYARIVHEQLQAAGIAVNGPAVTPLAGRSAGRVLLELLALPERDYRRQDVLGWLTVAPARWHERPVPIAAWERLSRAAGVVGHCDDWDMRLSRYAADLERRAVELADDPDESTAAADYLRGEARRTRQLRAFVVELIDDLEQARTTTRRWSTHAAWARDHLDRFTGGPTERAEWPVDERRAAERVEVALQRLAALDGMEGPVDLAVFTRTLTLELDNDLGRVGRFGDGVLVASISMGLGLDVDLAVVVGLAEGTFPTAPHDDSLLPDDERMTAGGELPLRRAGLDRQHRQLLAVLAGSRRHVLGVPRGDLRRSTERVPSRWVLDVASSLAGRQWWTEDLLAADVPWVRHVASFSGGLRDLAVPATAQEHRLRSLLAADPAGAAGLVDVTDDPVVAGGGRVVDGRRSACFTRFDGNVSSVTVASPTASVTSATRLEAWATCPFHYFVQHMLGVRAIDNPEDALQLSPLARGELVHRALELFVSEVLARPPAEQPGPDNAWTADDHARLAHIASGLAADFEASGLTGRAIFWRRDHERLLVDLDRFLDEDDRLRQEHRTRPVAAELAFGVNGAPLGAVPVALPDGRVLRFQGKADRIDRADDGTLHVLDYKTGKREPYKDLSEDDPDQRGTRLQLVVYGAAARLQQGDLSAPVRADYWFVSRRGGYKRHGYAVTDDVMTKVGDSLALIADGIEHGLFISRPTAVSSSPFIECASCDPDGLGVTELRRAWERKRADAAVRGYSEFAESDAESNVDGEGGDG
jgi:RecB family exonuclease